MGRRRPIGRKIYSLSLLLDKQPKTLQKGEHYSLLISYVNNTPELYYLRFNKRCYSLLHNGIIKPEHLVNFYRTYRLPKHPFFPLFLMVKRDFYRGQEEKKREKKEYIDRAFKQLPSHIRAFFKRISELEVLYHSSGKTPLYNLSLYPKTKKKADLYSHYSHEEWIECFEIYLVKLRERYDRIPRERTDRLLACFILLSIPVTLSLFPDKSLLKQSYRNLSKKYHPDSGGDPKVFIKIKWASDVLLSP
jgi:hypothetical protein